MDVWGWKWNKWGMTAIWDGENVLKLDCSDSCNTLNILKPTEVYILNG